ncbi:putative PurR-regulated permease PerM [Spinactinospora alkalitolerans]|uniref:Putative PurR-regulated permease PerM n=1 Tax=Spinactinospora alkalitolerans TaxID=687207 RepID=A0A852TXQ5_9ACTN|nr:AI-2E family transporter [Spinactinospora alkalitolerans]NYE46814.1 putative PurR-regulated permease PerM [Spinactinospora alkalitolerans]
MQLTRPSQWSFFRRRKPAAAAEEPREEVEVVVAEPEDEEDDLLRRVSDAAWRILIIGAVIVLLLWGATYIRVVVLPVILAVFLTALLMPFANWLRRKGLGRGASTTIVMLTALIVFSGSITVIVQPAVAGFQDLVASVGEAITQLEGIAASFGLDATTLNRLLEQGWSQLQDNRSQIVSGAWAGAVVVGEFLLGLVLVIVLTVYFVHSGDKLMEWVRELFPRNTRGALRTAGDITYGVMGRYVRGVALVGLFDAVLIGIVLLIVLDANLAIPLIMLTFIGAFLPVVGAFASGLLSALVAFVAEGWIIALIVVGATILIQQLESNLFAPRVYGKSLDLPSAVVLLAITIGSIVAGIAGAFLATPVAAVLAALLRNRPFADSRTEGAEKQRIAAGGAADGAGTEPAAAGDRDSPAPAAVPAETSATKQEQEQEGGGKRKR